MTKLALFIGGLWAQTLPLLQKVYFHRSGLVYTVWQVSKGSSNDPKLPLAPKAILPLTEDALTLDLRPDTLKQPKLDPAPTSLLDQLRSYIGAPVTLSVELGKDWEELSGTLQSILPNGDLILQQEGRQTTLSASILRGFSVPAHTNPTRILPGTRLRFSTPLESLTFLAKDSTAPWLVYHIIRQVSATQWSFSTWVKLPAYLPTPAEPFIYLIEEGQIWPLGQLRLEPNSAPLHRLAQGNLTANQFYRLILPPLDTFRTRSYQTAAQAVLALTNTSPQNLPAGTALVLDETGTPIPALDSLAAFPKGSMQLFPLYEETTLQAIAAETAEKPAKGRPTAPLYRGTIRLQNNTPTEAALEVWKYLFGEPLETGLAEATPLPGGYYLLRWRLTLKSGATETLNYAYTTNLH